MKNKILNIFIALSVMFLFTRSSCDLFDSFPVNIPISFVFTATGSNSTFDSGTYCLDIESETYKEYQDRIKNVTFIEAAFRTIAISDASIQVNLNVRILDAAGNTLINYTISNFRPADYMASPFILAFDQAQIQALNTYLGDINNKCFRAIVTLSGVSGTQSVNGALDVVIEAETEL